MSQKTKNNNEIFNSPQELWIVWALGPGLGAFLGWLIVPSELALIGLGGGAGFGGLLVAVWHFFSHKKRKSTTQLPKLGWKGKIAYLFFIGLCLYFVLLSLNVWVRDSERWVAALAGTIFGGVGFIIFILAWLRDSSPQSNQHNNGLILMGIGFSCFLMAIPCLFLVYLGSPMVGILGALFLTFCGFRIIQKGRKLNAVDLESDGE